MLKPPFQRARLTLGLHPGSAAPEPGADTEPATAQTRLRPVAPACCAPPARRPRLSALDQHMHCSVIGTCLGTAALRKLVGRHSDLDTSQASDLDVHHQAVSLAIEGGAGAKALHKLLDEQHAPTLRRFAALRDEASLGQAWDQALASGEVPGAYWALVTHPLASVALRQRAFGDVHMLSHLVGAANRADIRRLVALEAQNAALTEQLAQQQQRQLAALAERDLLIQALQQQVATQSVALARPAANAPALAALRQALDQARQDAALQRQRCTAAEHERTALSQAQDDALGRLDRASLTIHALLDEQRALKAELAPADDAAREAGVQGLRGAGAAHLPSPLRQALAGQRLLYVGGRPSSLTAIRQLVLACGGHWLHHDGGLEDRKGLLAAVLPGAQRVVFPVDCIDHDAMHRLKRLCLRHGLPYQALRSASLASFVAGVGQAGVAQAAAGSAAAARPVATDPPARAAGLGCLRHS